MASNALSPFAPPRSIADSAARARATAEALDAERADIAEQELTRRAKRALLFVFAPVVALASLILVLITFELEPARPILFAWMALGTISGVYGVFKAIGAVLDFKRIPKPIRPAGLWAAATAIPVGIFTSFLGAMTTLATLVQYTRGRQLRSAGGVALAPLEKESAWVPADTCTTEQVPPADPVREAVAAAWRQNGLTEHASVAAFARLSMELVALGAPPSLIEDAHKDALDEMRHTKLCFELARDLDGKSEGPAAFPKARSQFFPLGPKSVRLARLAVESLVDGAINEGISARVVAELSREVTDPKIKQVLSAIARDEARHAAHAFEIVRWCVEEGGYPVRTALRSSLAVLPARIGRGLTPGAEDGRFEAYGIPGRAREQRAYSIVRERILKRVVSTALMASSAYTATHPIYS